MKRIIAYRPYMDDSGLQDEEEWLTINCDDISYIEVEEDEEKVVNVINNEEEYKKHLVVHLKNGDVLPIYVYPNGYSFMTANELMEKINEILESEDENKAVYYECL